MIYLLNTAMIFLLNQGGPRRHEPPWCFSFSMTVASSLVNNLPWIHWAKSDFPGLTHIGSKRKKKGGGREFSYLEIQAILSYFILF